ncbi:MAG: RecQ family ATP-dependent DNA helicase [Bacteroides sp.]|nr:RecQ family ATP-dependent DNA helicase [Bacteroides sp.]
MDWMNFNGKNFVLGVSNVYNSHYAIIDVEYSINKNTICDIGAIRYDDATFHQNSKKELLEFINDIDFLCGHNIIHHDVKHLFGNQELKWLLVDTLYMSPLLFPERPYHKLLKDDKIINDQLNNPVSDCQKAKDLLFDEIAHWYLLPNDKRIIFATLLKGHIEFDGFLQMVKAETKCINLEKLIKQVYCNKICHYSNLDSFIKHTPCALAYALALIDTTDHRSITPGWVLHNFPEVEYIIKTLRHTICAEGCDYCSSKLNIHRNLKLFFGYDKFRTYEGEPLQEKATQAAIEGKSLLAIFPTGGGKSLTFQLPALMEGRTVHGLTVVISPLQSLMKDQVDNLEDRGITESVTINGMLDPISRSVSIQRVLNGDATLLYIAPEMLRSKTIEKILIARHVVRFVIDEAHCFSSWGQDFRVDYLYIGKFIRDYQHTKKCKVPVSCFTATAKQKVIQDICDYFKQTLDLNLELFASTASRTNLRYSVIYAETDDEKYSEVRRLVSESDCPTIIYVSRTKRTKELAIRLTRDGYKALAFHGKMDSDEKNANQEDFMTDQVRIIVATSAFGMGVDKKDVGLVIHYDISDSLENYVQEAGRAGRDPHLNARCFVLYSDKDLDKHFILLNQTKLSISEIQQVWKAVKGFTKKRLMVNCSALEIARQAGWDDSVSDIETRVRTALSALEQAGYLERGNNVPHVFASGITVKNVEEARKRISDSIHFSSNEIDNAVRIIKSLISQKYISKAQNSEAESRVDYLADILGLSKNEVISTVDRMRQEGILADTKDISVYLKEGIGDTERKTNLQFENFAKIERYIINQISDGVVKISYKQLNDNAQKNGVLLSKEKDIRTLLYFLTVKGYIRKTEDAEHNMEIFCIADKEKTIARFERRLEVCRFVITWLYHLALQYTNEYLENNAIQFSIIELLHDIKASDHSFFIDFNHLQLEDVEEALLYLSKIGVLKLEGGFLVLYNAMSIRRIKDNKFSYKQDDYRMLNEFYKQKIQQVHIVGEYANLMVRDYSAALQYVQDYFQMDYKKFIAKYFKGERHKEIERNLTPEKYNQLFGNLSKCQLEIISDKDSRCIVVAAGPGSGKTRVLVHKLASLLMLEDVKHEQLLMLTFSRAAASEFKQRLMGLIGNAAHFVEIKTFHSFCFDLLGRIGNLNDVKDVVSRAAEMIEQGDVEPTKIGKTVLVIDEAQDMSAEDYSLVKALMNHNEEMRVIAVGDDDQNIYDFRGSDSKYMFQLLKETGSRLIEMTDNFRSSQSVVRCANSFIQSVGKRMKSTPIISKRDIDGIVSITYYKSKYMYSSIINQLILNKGKGTSCILTQTNEEAAILMALLHKYGIHGKLIQTMDGFSLWNLAEIRYFLKCLGNETNAPVIPQELWDKSKKQTFQAYNTSKCLNEVKRCLEKFESLYRVKYYTDFREFIFESSIEDFFDMSNTDIVVSTIHKAKGREFDDVYMLLSDVYTKDANLIRRYYVGMTRAKNRLFIHTNWDFFNRIPSDKYTIDSNEYSMPEQVTLQLTHKDLYLGYFKGEERKKEILSLRSGDVLNYNDTFFYNSPNNIPIAKLSKSMQLSLEEWYEKGYIVKSSSIRYIVAWKPKDAPKNESETAVVLIDMLLENSI